MLGRSGELRCCAYCTQVVYTSAGKAARPRKAAPAAPGGTPAEAAAPGKGRGTAISQLQSLFSFGGGGQGDVLDLAQCLKLLQVGVAEGSLELKAHRNRLVTYGETLVACELVEWLLERGAVRKRTQAVQVGQELLDAKYVRKNTRVCESRLLVCQL